MKVLHFILGKAAKERANGVNQVVAGLAKYCARQGAEVRVIGKARSVECEGQVIARDGFEVRAFSRWAAPLRNELREGIAWSDVVHLHGVYSPWNVLVGRMCNRAGRPYVVTLHGGLAPELTRARGRVRKRVFLRLLDRRHLARATAIHVLAPEEATDLYAVVTPRKVFYIPNGVDLEDYPATACAAKSRPPFVIGGLGRISPEKNLEALCHAFTAVNRDGAMSLRIAGPMSDYGERLQRQFDGQNIEFVGSKFGTEKLAFLRSLDLFVHPSLCEGSAIVVMESLALATPLLVTHTSKVAYLYDRNAFFMCEPTAFGLEQGLREAFTRHSEWQEKSANGRRLIETRLNWAAAAHDLLNVYAEVVGAQV